MAANPFVLDISSDDEQATPLPSFDEEPPQPSEEDYEWFREVLQGVYKDKESQEKLQPPRDEEVEDSDEIVILGECCNPPEPKAKRPGSKLSVPFRDDDDDDDDCVVLDDDPDGRVEFNDGGFGVGDGDDLLVVGQKGQIACRDYPHSRHLCIKFPFNSSPHGKHCELCHCYVCDTLAPCAYWGIGVSKVDHCHATDKQELWKSLRNDFRLGKGAPLPSANTTTPVAATQINQIAPVHLTTSLVPPNMVSRPITIRPCSSSAPFGLPNIISESRDQQSVQKRNGLGPCAISQQALGVPHNLIHHGRVPPVSNTHGLFASSSNVMFKRPGTVGRTLATNHSVYSQSHSRRHAPLSQYPRYSAPLASSVDKNTGGKQDALSNFVSESFWSPTNSVMCANVVGSELSGQGVSLPNQNDTAQVLPDIEFNWLISESNQEMSAGNIQLQNTWTNNEPSSVTQLSSQLSVGGHYENWFSSPSVPMPSEYLSPGLNAFPFEPPDYDASMLYFDFETSWKSVTHA